MKSASTILVSGALAYDYVFLYPQQIRDHLVTTSTTSLYVNLRTRGPFRRYGGCGGNVVYNLALLGASTKLSSWIGNDGQEYLKRLQELGIDTSEISLQKLFVTPTGILLVDSKEDQILFFGEPAEPIIWPLPSLDDVKMTVITAGIPRRALKVIHASRKAQVPFIVDPGKFIMDITPELLIKGIEGAHTLVLNEYERDLLIRRSGCSWKTILSLISTSVTTMGSRGAIIETCDKKVKIPATTPSHMVDPSGAGDAFLAGYSFGKFHCFSPEFSTKIGAVTASFAIEVKGAQGHKFTFKNFEERFKHHYGQPEQALPFHYTEKPPSFTLR